MAKSRFEYVKTYEQSDRILPDCWIVIRLDGKAFTSFCASHNFDKPNDIRGLSLMDHCAKVVLETYTDIRMAYGQSDEYSFVLHKASTLYGRRASKLVSLVASCFAANYVYHWPEYFPNSLQMVPYFDGRAVAYPTEKHLRDYLAWRQADVHINNQYNTCFWALVASGVSRQEAQATLKGTQTGDKHELLFSRFGINYNHLPEQFRKGSVIYHRRDAETAEGREAGSVPGKLRKKLLVVTHEDIIGNDFWQSHPEILA